MRFGEYIQKLRESKGLSLTVAARELGITPQRLCDIEQGRRNFTKSPPTALLQKISVVYDHPYSSLIVNSEFFQYEKSIITDLMSELEPVCAELETTALEMITESHRFTPEMEALTKVNLQKVQELKTAVLLAKTRYSRASRTRGQ